MWGALAYLLMEATVPPDSMAPASQSQPPATAAPAFASHELSEVETVPDAELATHRGGFAWEGVRIGLGAEIRSYLNGQLVLQTNISWTDAGAHKSQIISGALTQVDAAQLHAGILSSGGISMKVGDQSVFLANEGQTALLHRTDGAIQNVIVNRASNIQADQQIDAVLDLENFGPLQDHIANMRVGAALGDMISQPTIGSLNN
jgi:hypothetical protein